MFTYRGFHEGLTFNCNKDGFPVCFGLKKNKNTCDGALQKQSHIKSQLQSMRGCDVIIFQKCFNPPMHD